MQITGVKKKCSIILFSFLILLILSPSIRAEENFTIIVLPDTQHYSEKYPDILKTQIRWILDNKDSLNIKFVIFLGDLVEDGSNETQWKIFAGITSLLDGNVPYSVIPGNHDGMELYRKYFSEERFQNFSYWGGSYNRNRCSYQFFTGNGEEYIVVNLGWNPQDDELKWADSILKRYKDRKAIVVTHGFLNVHAIRDVHGMGDTTYIWDRLIVPNKNVFLVLCGHAHGEARRADIVQGRVIHQLLANYQDRNNGGNGWLRILEFKDGGIHVKTYSPYLGRYERDSNSQFTLQNTKLSPDLGDILFWKFEKFIYEVYGAFKSLLRKFFLRYLHFFNPNALRK